MCDQVINDFLSTLHNKKIAYFGTAGFGGSKEYYDSLWNRIKNNIDVSNTLFKPYFCQGKMPVSVRNRYVDLIHKHPDDKKLQVSIDNFDKALTHPDQKDKENAKKWILDIIKAQE